eukprot:scaffold219363_cov28-Prasinocladus_malaysianus.AAC.1
MRCLDLAPALVTAKRFMASFVDIHRPPMPKDLDRVLVELLEELRDLAVDGIRVTLPNGVRKRIRAVLKEWVTVSRGGEKLELERRSLNMMTTTRVEQVAGEVATSETKVPQARLQSLKTNTGVGRQSL